MARNSTRQPQRSKRDRISTKVADRIAMHQVSKALRQAEEDEARHGHWSTFVPGQGVRLGFDSLVIG